VDARQSRTRAQLLLAHRQRQHLHILRQPRKVSTATLSASSSTTFLCVSANKQSLCSTTPNRRQAVQERRPIWGAAWADPVLPASLPTSSTWLKSFGANSSMSGYGLTTIYQQLHYAVHSAHRCRLVAHHQLLNPNYGWVNCA